MKLPNLKLPVDVTPGTTLEKAFQQTMILADHLGLEVAFKFNGIHCESVPGTDWRNGPDNYWKVAETKSTYKLATTRKR